MRRTARFLMASALAAATYSGPAVAQSCDQWSADGTFRLRLSNGYTVRCTLNQDGQNFAGYCSAGGNDGDAKGWIKNSSQFRLDVTWDGGARGRYTGVVNDDGDVEDSWTYDRSNPDVKARWSNTSGLTCAS